MHTDSTALIRLLQYIQTWRKGVKTLVEDHRRIEELLLLSGSLLHDTNVMYFPNDVDDAPPDCPEYVNSSVSQLDLEILAKVTELLKQVSDFVSSSKRPQEGRSKKPKPRQPKHPKRKDNSSTGTPSTVVFILTIS